MNVNVAIIGAGPSGLCFAQALAESGLRIAVLERQAETALASPAFDGREIALTHHSAQTHARAWGVATHRRQCHFSFTRCPHSQWRIVIHHAN